MSNSPQPLVRWAGSKRKLLPHLLASSPSSFGRYFEPFFGSGCFFFALRPTTAVLGDINAALIEFYRVALLAPLAILRRARRIPRQRDSYYRIRSRIVSERDPVRRAAYFLFLNRFCFNGIYRTNTNGVFNVPFGTDTGSFPTEREFGVTIEALRAARFVCDDFQVTLNSAEPGDFVYIDPPYVYRSRRDRGEYGPKSFSVADIERLRCTLESLDERGVRFLVSYLSCQEAEVLAQGFRKTTVSVKRCVSGLLAARKSVDEVLIRNY